MSTPHQHTKLIQEIQSLPSPRFASFEYQTRGTGEKARYTVLLGARVLSAYKADKVWLQRERAKIKKRIDSEQDDMKIQDLQWSLIACEELIESLKISITEGVGNNPNYTNKDVYINIAPGVKLHVDNGEVHVYGFLISKVQIAPGEEKKAVKSSPKTIAKNKLRHQMKSGKFRQFAIPDFTTAKINGKVLTF